VDLTARLPAWAPRADQPPVAPLPRVGLSCDLGLSVRGMY